MSGVPNPGSPDAVKQGCTCDPVQNEGGNGKHGNWLMVKPGCPVHTKEWMLQRLMGGKKK